MSKPTVLLIAGGKNSRFFPLNTATHKGFLPLMGRPLVVRALESLAKHDFTDVVLVVSPRDFASEGGIQEELARYSLPLTPKIVLQTEAKGQGDAVLCAREHLKGSCILLSPYYVSAGIIAQKLWQQQQTTNSDCVFLGTKVTDTTLYGILAFDAQDRSRVVGVVEKPQHNPPSEYKINSAYLFSHHFIETLAQTTPDEYSLETAITTFAKEAHCSWVENTETLASLKYPWHLFDSLAELFTHTQSHTSASATVSSTAIIDTTAGPVVIDDEATIGDFVKLAGPCYIGKKAFIGDYSFVRGSSVEEGVVLGAYTELVRSIVFPKTTMHSCYIADSILGHGVKIGAGCITANKRFDRATIRTEVKDRMVDTHRKNLGTIMGAGVTTGIGVKIMPGVLVGAGQALKPGELVTRNSPHA